MNSEALRKFLLLDPEDEHYRDKTYNTGYGYPAIWENGKTVFLHKKVLGLGAEVQVDHKNENKLDCRKDNLRVATRSQNGANRAKFLVPTASKYKGVYWRKDRNSWIACIRVNKKYIYLGSGTEEQCAKLYNVAAEFHFDEFAKLNEVKDEAITSNAQ